MFNLFKPKTMNPAATHGVLERVCELAKKEIGYEENPKNSNRTKYGEWFGMNGMPWCGIFVSWLYWHAGCPLKHVGFAKGFAGCQTAVKVYREKGMITTNPLTGDIVFFDWNNDGRFDHTGILIAPVDPDGNFLTIEGNTALGNDSNGGQVMRRMRNRKQAIFAHVLRPGPASALSV